MRFDSCHSYFYVRFSQRHRSALRLRGEASVWSVRSNHYLYFITRKMFKANKLLFPCARLPRIYSSSFALCRLMMLCSRWNVEWSQRQPFTPFTPMTGEPSDQIMQMEIYSLQPNPCFHKILKEMVLSEHLLCQHCRLSFVMIMLFACNLNH